MSNELRLENRIDVHDHCEAGRKIIEWTLDPKKRPYTLEEFKEAMGDILTVPERYKTLEWVSSKDDKLVIRLPEKELLEESLDRAKALDDQGASLSAIKSFYGLPTFYEDLYRGVGFPSSIGDLLNCRIGDYTIASCK